MTQRRSGQFLDPDYRHYPWNESRFAPKNRASGLSITLLSLLITTIAFAQFIIPSIQNRSIFSDFFPFKMFAVPIAFYIVWVCTGVILRTLLWFPVKRNADQRRAAKSSQESRNFAFSAKAFEDEVAEIITFLSGFKAEVVGKAGDGGVDIRIYKGNRFIGIAQCKYSDPVKTLPPRYIRELYAVKQRVQVEKAYLVTTARFSVQSVSEAQAFGIDLIDGAKLRELKEKRLSAQRV
jgi:hypothetical protein